MEGLSSFVPLRKECGEGKNTKEKKLQAVSDCGDKLRSRYRIEVDGTDIPDPIECFEEMSLPNRILIFLKRTKNFSKPTPIQMQAIGCLLKSRDVIGLSQTGSGKTYAYLLPLCSFLWKNHASFNTFNSVKPLCLILVPTRELMHQVCELTKELIENLDLPTGNNNNVTSRDGHEYNNLSQVSINPSTNHPHFHRQVFREYPPEYRESQANNYFQQMMGYGQFHQRSYHGSHIPQPPKSYHSQQYGYNDGSNFFVTPRYPVQHMTSDIPSGEIVVGLCGGVPIKDDLTNLSRKTKVVISTPGRLIDLCERGEIDLQEVRYFVLDECDRSLEMGTEEQLRKIVAMVTVNEKTMLRTSLWSATLPESLERLARSAVVDPVYICSGIKDTISANISQNVLFVHTYQKEKVLLDILRKTAFPPVIVFTSSRDKVDYVTEFLQDEQFHAAAMHSGKDQGYRNNVMRDFRGSLIDVLVATDLASRGLDIPAVSHVIHYDTPDTIEDYIHRSGRTGRFGRQGKTSTLLTLDCKIAQELKDLLETSKADIPPQLKDVKSFGKNVLHTDMGDRLI